MTVKTSISLTDHIHEKAMQLVQSGAYPHLSALVQQAMRDLLAAEEERGVRLQTLRSELKRRLESTDFVAAEEVFDAIDADFTSLLKEGSSADRFAVE